MTDAPSTVSVISALHQPGEYLDGFLRRLDDTSDESTQIILVDDCSADGTAEAIERWRAGRSHIVLITNSTNIGVAASRNVAVAAATAEFIWFVDHDDVWDTNITRILRAAADGRPEIDVVACRAEYRYDPAVAGPVVDGLGVRRTVSGPEGLRMMAGNVIHGFLWSKLFRRRVLGSSPFPELSSQSDVAGLARVMAAADTVTFVPDVLYSYMNRPGSITRIRKPNFDNLAAARTAVIDAVRSTEPTTQDVELLNYFTCWFYCRALVLTPVRQKSGLDVVAPALTQAKHALAGMPLGPIRARSRQLWLLMWGVRLVPRATSLAVRVSYLALDTVRQLRRPERTESVAVVPSAA